MKEKIIYIVSFLLAFVIATGMMIYLSGAFNNIFVFDFSPPHSSTTEVKQPQDAKPSVVQPKDSTAKPVTPAETIKPKEDSVKTKPAVTAAKDTSAVKPAGVKTEKEIKPVADKNAVVQNLKPDQALNVKNTAKKDSSYNDWIKSTVKLYESMETSKAAKIILGYSDNIARDILLKMKKKKAAEILAEFKPEIATRIISVVQ